MRYYGMDIGTPVGVKPVNELCISPLSDGTVKKVVDLYRGDVSGKPVLIYRDMAAKFATQYAALANNIQIVTLNPITDASAAVAGDYSTILAKDANGNMFQLTDPGIKFIASDGDKDAGDLHYSVSSLYYGK